MTKLSEKIKSRMDGDYPVIVQRTTLQDWLKDAEHLEGGGWIPVALAVPREDIRVEVRDAEGRIGFAHTSWPPFTVVEGEIIPTMPQYNGFFVEASADLTCPVGVITEWRPIEGNVTPK